MVLDLERCEGVPLIHHGDLVRDLFDTIHLEARHELLLTIRKLNILEWYHW